MFEAKIGKWEEGKEFPNGHLIRPLGEASEIHPCTQAILIDNDVDHGDFKEAVVECLKPFLPPPQETGNPDTWWKIPEEEVKKRRDLRDVCICTIDPLTAKDIDDALHVTKLKDGTYEVGVHIADVSYFVLPNTALNEEAKRRCTTVYLTHKVIPMLPPLLSEQLCSLNPGVDRLAYSVIWNMTVVKKETNKATAITVFKKLGWRHGTEYTPLVWANDY